MSATLPFTVRPSFSFYCARVNEIGFVNRQPRRVGVVINYESNDGWFCLEGNQRREIFQKIRSIEASLDA